MVRYIKNTVFNCLFQVKSNISFQKKYFLRFSPTLFYIYKIEGTFKLETPPIMLGYTRDPRLSHIQSLTNVETAINMEMPIIESSYISLYVTIEPQLLIPEAYRESVKKTLFFP